MDGSGSYWVSYNSGTDNKGYFVPLPLDNSSLTNRTRTATWSGTSRTGNIGGPVNYDSGMGTTAEANLQSWGFRKATSSSGYWAITRITDPEGPQYEWRTWGWYIPLYESLSVSTTTTVTGCETPVVAQPSSQLISCVTERLAGSSLDFTAVAPASGNYIGSFAHGTSKSNYSSDGKCWVGGRELPQVIALTNSRSTLSSFFANRLPTRGSTRRKYHW